MAASRFAPKKNFWNTLALFKTLLVFFAVALAFYFAVAHTNDATRRNATHTAAQAIADAAVLCYALEGVYPPTLDYLKENYGLMVDSDRYQVHYRSFAANLFPEIQVFEKEGAR